MLKPYDLTDVGATTIVLKSNRTFVLSGHWGFRDNMRAIHLAWGEDDA